MKTISNFLATLTIAALGLSGPVAGADYAGGRLDGAAPHRFDHQVDRRQNRQWSRIASGIADGDLSRREARRLRKDQRKIARMERHFDRDGYCSPRERRALDRALDRASQRIERARHRDHGRHHYRHRHGWHGGHRSVWAPLDEHYTSDDSYLVGSVSSTTVSAKTEGFSVSWSTSEQH